MFVLSCLPHFIFNTFALGGICFLNFPKAGEGWKEHNKIILEQSRNQDSTSEAARVFFSKKKGEWSQDSLFSFLLLRRNTLATSSTLELVLRDVGLVFGTFLLWAHTRVGKGIGISARSDCL